MEKISKNGVATTISVIGILSGLFAGVYWAYLGSVNANAKEALTIGNDNKAEISSIKTEIQNIKDDTGYIRQRIDKITDLK